MSRKYPGTPEPEEIPELLEHYREAERTDKEEDAAFYFDGLSKGTSDFKELFRAHPPENHPALWEAIYTADNDEWCYNLPSGALLSLFCDYAELFRGACPAFRLLRNWIGHGFGYQGVRQDPRLSVAGRGQKKRALVPGYGRGLDALALAKVFGYEVVGVDVSESALESARVLEEEVTKIELLHRNPTQVKNSRMRFWMRMIQSSDWVKRRELSKPILWREADFLSENCFKDGEKFDLIVDNYFFTALHPSLRPLWAQKMVDLLARPHGKLICRETPADKDFCEGGPPHSAAFWFYQLHLAYPGNDKIVDYEKGVIDLSPETTSTSGPGLTLVARCLCSEPNEMGLPDHTWMTVWSPALGGVRRKETPAVPEINAPSENRTKAFVGENTPKPILKRRKAQDTSLDLDDCPPLDNSADSVSSKSKSPPEEDDLYDSKPAATVQKRVKFSEPSS